MTYSTNQPKTISIMTASGHSTRFYPAPFFGKDAGFIVRQCRAIYGFRRNNRDVSIFVETPSMRPSV
jgi:hypothetical protein